MEILNNMNDFSIFMTPIIPLLQGEAIGLSFLIGRKK